MKPRIVRKLLPMVAGASLLFGSCALFPTAVKPGLLDMTTESMENGHLVQISVDRPVGSVSAFVTPANWLIVTFVDSLLDPGAVRSFRSRLVDTVEVTQFPSALQLALHLTVKTSAVEVVHDDPSDRVLISLFTDKQRRGDRK